MSPSNHAIDELISLIPPPDVPIGAPGEAHLDAVRTVLGFRFHDDYLNLMRMYGNGAFAGELTFRPLCSTGSAWKLDKTSVRVDLWSLGLWQRDFAAGDATSFPGDPYPNQPGLFPIASDSRGGAWFMHVDRGEPMRLTTVANMRDSEFEVFSLTPVELLVAAVAGRVKSELASSETLREVRRFDSIQ